MSKKNVSWPDKYRPTSWNDIQGQNKSIKAIKKWAKNWSMGDPALLLHGPAGTGKTSTVEVVGNEMGYPINEINTSSARRKDDIVEIADEAVMSPVDEDFQVVLLDEVDSWSTASVAPIRKLLDNTPNPIIMTCNEVYQVPDSLRYHDNVMTFKFTLGKRSVKAKLKEIIKKEDVDVSDAELDDLANRPDLRSAINDLQALASGGTLEKDGREWEVNEWSAIKKHLQGDNSQSSRLKADSLIMWLDENMTESFSGMEASLGYGILGKADLNLYRSQKYAGALAELTAECLLTEPDKDHWIDLDFPNWFRQRKPEHHYSSQYTLYQELKGDDYEFSGNFLWFRKVILPLLEDLKKEDRYQLSHAHGLSDTAMGALDISKSDMENWREVEEPQEPEVHEADGMSADW